MHFKLCRGEQTQSGKERVLPRTEGSLAPFCRSAQKHETREGQAVDTKIPPHRQHDALQDRTNDSLCTEMTQRYTAGRFKKNWGD